MFVHSFVHMKGTLNFKIRPLPSGQGSIQVIYSYGRGTEIRLATGKKIKSAANWNYDRQKVKNLLAEKEAASINQWLSTKYVEIETALNSLENSNPDFNTNHVKSILRIAIGKANKEDLALAGKTIKIPNLLECYDWYIKYFSKNPTPTTPHPLAKSTTRTFNTTLKIFQEFCDHSKKYNYEDIDMEFYEKFVNWLRAKDYSTNYIGNNIKNLKTVMNYALSRGYHSNLDFKKREFAKPKEETEAIYLDENELTKIFNLELPDGLSHSRDLFLIGCYTGLRVSDYNRLKPENLIEIKGKIYIKIKSKKTKGLLTIPCNTKVLQILKKYGGDPPPSKPDQHINRDLKKIGAAAKINTLISIRSNENKVKKYTQITTHCARRSFCTNAYKAGIPTFDIMQISGHQTERIFYSYIRVTNEDKAQKIAEHSFFK